MIMRVSVSGGRFERDPQQRRHLRGIAFFHLAKQSERVQNQNLRGRARRVELGTIGRIEPNDGAHRRQRERPERRESTDDGQPHHTELDRLSKTKRRQAGAAPAPMARGSNGGMASSIRKMEAAIDARRCGAAAIAMRGAPAETLLRQARDERAKHLDSILARQSRDRAPREGCAAAHLRTDKASHRVQHVEIR